MTNLIWSIVLAVIGVTGMFMVGQKNLFGWIISFSVQILWIIFALVTGQYGFILSAIIFGWVYARNFLKWRKEQQLQRSDDRMQRIFTWE